MTRLPLITGVSTAMWEKLDEQILSSPAVAITFSGISSAFVFFSLSVYALDGATATASVELRLNNDSGANYERQMLRILSTTLLAERLTGQTLVDIDPAVDSDAEGMLSVYIAKTLAGDHAQMVINAGADSSGIGLALNGGRWTNTADLINRIDVIRASNLNTGTRVLLEGAKVT